MKKMQQTHHKKSKLVWLLSVELNPEKCISPCIDLLKAQFNVDAFICSYAGLKKLHGSSSFQKRHSTCGFVGHPHTLSFWPSRRELTTIKIPKNKSAALDSPKHLWPWTTFQILIESLWDPSIKDLFSSHIGISDVFFLILGKLLWTVSYPRMVSSD